MKRILSALMVSINLALCLSATAAKAPKVKTLAIGSKAPSFTLEGVDGKQYTLDSFKDAKYLVLVFTCNHCPDARATWGRLNSFAAEYAKKGVQVVAISTNSPKALLPWENGYSVFGDSFPEMKQVSKDRELVFPYLYDGDTQEVGLAYGAMATPHTFILGPDRTLLYHGQFDDGRRDPGPAEKNVVKDNIDALLAGKTIKKTIMRTFGCSTKWAYKQDWVVKKQKEWDALPVSVEAITAEKVKELVANKTGKVRVINVWSAGNKASIAEFPNLIDTYRRYHRRPFDLITIAVDPDNRAKSISSVLEKQHLPTSPHSKAVMQKEGRSTNNYHYQNIDLGHLKTALKGNWQGQRTPIPHTMVIAPGGQVVYTHSGAINPVELRKAIVKVLESM